MHDLWFQLLWLRLASLAKPSEAGLFAARRIDRVALAEVASSPRTNSGFLAMTRGGLCRAIVTLRLRSGQVQALRMTKGGFEVV